MTCFVYFLEMFMNLPFDHNGPRRRYGIREDPLEEYGDKKLYELFRFDRRGIDSLLDRFHDDFPAAETNRGMPLPNETQLLATLGYLASNGGFQSHIANELDISQPSVSRSVANVCRVISVVRME